MKFYRNTHYVHLNRFIWIYNSIQHINICVCVSRCHAIQAVPNKRQPRDSPRTTKQAQCQGQLPLFTWRLMAMVHSAPLSAAVTGKVHTKEEFFFRKTKEKES